MSSLSLLHTAVHANLHVIDQGIRLLEKLGAERYAARVAICYNASIGGHLRHIIEHYESFLSGYEQGEIDYEKRARDPLIEGNVSYAAATLENVAAGLRHLDLPSMPANSGYCAETVSTIARTSVLRELEFLLSHTIHHYALVAVMARLQGCEPEADFGVAPSTLKFQQAQAAAACAR